MEPRPFPLSSIFIINFVLKSCSYKYNDIPTNKNSVRFLQLPATAFGKWNKPLMKVVVGY